MHSDQDIERWGEIFTKHDLYKRLSIEFYRFLSLTNEAKHKLLKSKEVSA